MAASPDARYHRRVVDDEIDELIAGLPALALEGAKGVGKTATASRRAGTARRLDERAQRSIAVADPARLLDGTPPVLIDEWQHVPELWDLVRRAVDAGAPAGRFLLTGSASPAGLETHSGAARIVTVRMRPLALAERGGASPTVSLGSLLSGQRPTVEGAGTTGARGLRRRDPRLRLPRPAGAVRAAAASTARRVPGPRRRPRLPRARTPGAQPGCAETLDDRLRGGNIHDRLLREDPRRRHQRSGRQAREDDDDPVPRRPRTPVDPRSGARMAADAQPLRPALAAAQASARRPRLGRTGCSA